MSSSIHTATPQQVREALSQLGLSQLGLARALGVDGRTVRRWVAGDSPLDSTSALALHLLLDPGVRDLALAVGRRQSRAKGLAS